MATLCLESNEDNSKLWICGDTNLIFNNRRANRLLKDNIPYVSLENKIEISVNEDNLKHILELLKIISGYISVPIEYSTTVSNEICRYKQEDEKFKIFSEKSRDIRDNHCDVDDFKNFTNSLTEHLPNRTLYPLQLLSAYHLAFSQNGCNFSVPGAGKTSIVYGAFAYLSNLNPNDPKYVDKIVIISPLNAFGPWELEYEECFGKKPMTKRLCGGEPATEKKTYLYSNNPATLTLLSYDSVPSLEHELQYFLQSHKVMVVLDEAHKIKKTDGGKKANSVLSLAPYCSSRVVLTGTPAPNGYEDLYNIYKFIWPTKKIIPFEVYQLKNMTKNSSDDTSDERIERLIKCIEPFFIRIKKSDLGLPPVIENPPIYVPMTPSQRRIYDIIENKYMADIISVRENSFYTNIIKAKMIRLMQAATNPKLLSIPLASFIETSDEYTEPVIEDDKFIMDILAFSNNEIPPKFIKAKEIIEKIIKDGEKVVVWAIFIKNILEFQAYLEHEGIPSKTLYGGTPVRNGEEKDDEALEATREGIISEFHNPNSSFKVIIANPFAVAESISLHKVCHNAIYLERSFNAAHYIQSKDRIHRYGLEKDIMTNYYYLLSESSIDSTIDERLLEKEKRLANIIENMPIPLFENSELETGNADIKALIADYVRRTKAL